MRYPWKRFWCPRNGAINLSDGGFLYDPDSEYATYSGTEAVAFEKIAHLPCMALLGEPGIGKSAALDDLREMSQESAAATGGKLLYINLNEYGDESRLIRDLFEAEDYTAWIHGDHILHLFIDSLDECRLRIPQVGVLMANRLRRVRDHLPRLRLRIACRTADWPESLDGALPELWGKDAYGAFELVPLRWQDASLAADANGVDPERFREELNRTETVPLAIKPVTLGLLLSVFDDQGRLPRTRYELYERGCLMLCDEPNPDRRSSGEVGALSAQEKMAVASKVAAVSIFCRFPIIAIGGVEGTEHLDEINASELVGGDEPVGTSSIMVSQGAIREAIATGLFSARGPQRMGFSHQTYAEFLASRYLTMQGVSAKTALSVLCHPDDPDGHIVPQLYEVAGWAASVDAEVLTTIARRDPKVLLRCDESSLDDDSRRIIISELLQALQDGRDNDREWDLHRKYTKLAHPDLAEQLLPWIVDATKADAARETAIEIAKVCGVRDVQAALVDIVLNPSEVLRVRDAAAYALCDIADTDTLKRLVPAAKDEIGNDPQDQLKGNALPCGRGSFRPKSCFDA
jgi:hypothetical protein